MEKFVINGETRTDLGKKATKAVRNANNIPCVIYGGSENIHFSVTNKEVRGLLYTPNFYLVEINVGGKTYTSILKEVQTHPVTDNILHLDFQEVSAGKPVFAEVPVRLTGLAVGVKAGGKLMLIMRRLKVKTTLENLVPEISIDVTDLELGKAVRVRDVSIDGIEFVSAGAAPIATVEITRALRAAKSAATTGTESAGEAVETAAESE